jgi:NAD(P)-dependent dehydrogenase (short-subunit alcohol dehydrogenase family)
MERAVERAVKSYGRLDILFNNAGISQPFTLTDQQAEEDWDRIIRVDLKGVFLGCKYAIPIMKRQRSGSIISTGSTAAVGPSAGILAYVAAKGGVITMTRALAMELAPANIRVNCISPGGIDTPIWNAYAAGGRAVEQLKEGYAAITPLRRLGTPAEIAHAALYFASDESAFTTGENLVVGGGATVGTVFDSAQVE